jgi:TonB family protein
VVLERDGKLCHTGSMILHAVVVGLALLVPPALGTIDHDRFEQGRVWVRPEERRVLYPAGAWVATRPTFTAEEGSGRRAGGAEGKMGGPLAPRRSALFSLKGPRKNPDPHLARQLARESAEHHAVLRLLGRAAGGPLASVLGRDSAIGYDAESAMGGLVGGSHASAYGVGGLGLVGTGRGGCDGGQERGRCHEGDFVGLGNMGTIGRGMGVGRGAGYGRGSGSLAGYQAGAPRVVSGRANVIGALDKALIRRVVRRHINEWRYCYERELQPQPALTGRIITSFIIGPRGTVLSSKVDESTVGNAAVERCVAQAVRRWRFPAPRGGGIVVVSYPVVFRTAGD